MKHRAAIVASISLALATTAHADLKSLGGSLLQGLGNLAGGGKTTTAPTLTQDDAIAGLKEALAQGAEIAVRELGRSDGFLGNPQVRIPLPGPVERLGTGMRNFGLGSYVDQFENSMNRAAEEAVPEALALLKRSVRDMSFDDAMGILRGEDDAATQYFRDNNSDALAERFLPIVQRATASVGVTDAYKRMVGNAGMLAQFVDADRLDLDRYVTGKAMDGLFLMLAAEEKRIRENPVARTTDLLKRVFSGI